MKNTSHPSPLTLRISITDRCQLKCRYCVPPENTSLLPREDIITYEEIDCFVQFLQEEFGLTKVRITGGDPLVRADIEKLIAMLAARHIPDIALTTNGQTLGKMAEKLKSAGLHRVNISLDALNPDVYRRITGGDVSRVVHGIHEAIRHGLHPVKLNMVVMKDVNESDLEDMVEFALKTGCTLRFLELMPIGHANDLFATHFVPSESVRERLGRQYRMSPLPTVAGSSSCEYEIHDSTGKRGRIGFISGCTSPFCSGCRRLRITSDGRMLGCLARDAGVRIRPFLQASDRIGLRDAVRDAMLQKRSDAKFWQSSDMASIGG